jgi:hypothetical protein
VIRERRMEGEKERRMFCVYNILIYLFDYFMMMGWKLYSIGKHLLT